MEKFYNAYITKKDGDMTITYRTGMTTYTEGLRDGIFVSLGWNGAGYIPHAHGGCDNAILNPEDYTDKSSFIVELDGQSIISHFECVDIEQTDNGKNLTVKVVLKHKLRPVIIKVCTTIDGSPVLSRWLEIENTADRSAALGRLSILSGGLETTKRWRNHILDRAKQSPYRVGYFESTNHMHEGMFRYRDLPIDCFSFGARYARIRYRHPFFVLENNAKGTTFIGQLAYSGGYRFSFDVNEEDHVDTPSQSGCCFLGFNAEIEAAHPIRVLEPKESLTTPELIIGMVNGDMDEAINGMHSFVRNSVMYPQARNKGCWVETAGGGEINYDKKMVDRAAGKGYDIFYIDAGWYFPQGEDCLGWTGSWDVDKKRYPNGIKELADYCHSKGLLFGMWMEPERIGSFNPNAEKLAHYLTKGYNDKNNGGYPIHGKGGIVDMANDEAAKWVEDEVTNMIANTGIDMFRLDFNHVYNAPVSYNMRDGFLENCDYRYNERVGKLYDKLRKKFPEVIFENCASGGGRTDLGMVKRFCHTWITDNPISPRCFDITNGLTMCLPPELIDRLVTTMDAHSMADLDFQLRMLYFSRPTSHSGIGCGTPEDSEFNTVQSAHFDHFHDLYNNFVRTFIATSKIYHHTPALIGEDTIGTGILEMVSEDKKKAIMGVFRLADDADAEIEVSFKGIDAGKMYKVTMDSTGESFMMEGRKLKYKGLKLIKNASLTSELIILEEK